MAWCGIVRGAGGTCGYFDALAVQKQQQCFSVYAVKPEVNSLCVVVRRAIDMCARHSGQDAVLDCTDFRAV